jgi:hypothetical protein
MFDFFKYFLYDYLNVSKLFDAVGNSKTNSPFVDIKLEMLYEDSETYNYQKLYEDIQTILNNRERLLKTYQEFENQILIPNIDAAVQYDTDNTYIKEDDIIKILNRVKDPNVGEYADSPLPIYSKKNNEELGYVVIWRRDLYNQRVGQYDTDADYIKNVEVALDYEKNKNIIDERLMNKVSDYLRRYPRYEFPEYNEELSRNFLLNKLGGQMTFKDFIKRKKGKSEDF